nr:UDP-glucuronosyltransferase [Plutella xylostella]
MILRVCFVALAIFASSVNSARILAIYPVASVSHQVVFRALTLELAKRGHELVVFTPNPALPKDRPKDNVTEIDMSESYQLFFKLFMHAFEPVRGVIFPAKQMSEYESLKMMIAFVEEVYKMEEFKKIISDKTQKFDLIMAEALFVSPLMVSKIFDAPTIWFSSFYGSPNAYETVGAPGHPMLYPNYFRGKFVNLSLWDKIYETYLEFQFWYNTRRVLSYEESLVKKYFGEEAPSIDELKNNVDLLFVNANPIFEGNRPVPPNVIYLGALHMQPLKELPSDLKSFLDNSKRGVVYVSLGTNVRFETMEPSLIDVFVKAFEAMPYDVLWKFDGQNIPNAPKNVKIQKWFPQRDLLTHPNIKAFVTQGGLQSTDEAIDAGVPFVGLPALGDQYFNTDQYVRLGIGIRLNFETLKPEELVNGVNTVVNDKSYRENVKKLGVLMRDQPQTPLERAVWWTEYVLRNKGAKHLRSPAANISWSEYLMLDVVAALATAVLLFLAAVGIVWRTVCKIFRKKVKVNKNKKE